MEGWSEQLELLPAPLVCYPVALGKITASRACLPERCCPRGTPAWAGDTAPAVCLVWTGSGSDARPTAPGIALTSGGPNSGTMSSMDGNTSCKHTRGKLTHIHSSPSLVPAWDTHLKRVMLGCIMSCCCSKGSIFLPESSPLAEERIWRPSAKVPAVLTCCAVVRTQPPEENPPEGLAEGWPSWSEKQQHLIFPQPFLWRMWKRPKQSSKVNGSQNTVLQCTHALHSNDFIQLMTINHKASHPMRGWCSMFTHVPLCQFSGKLRGKTDLIYSLTH